MEVCSICQQPLYQDELIKRYRGGWFTQYLAHVDCYKRYMKIMWTFGPFEAIFAVAGIVLTIFGGDGLGDPTPDLSHSAAITMLVVGVACLVGLIALGIANAIKYFDIRKHPGEHLKTKEGPFGPTR